MNLQELHEETRVRRQRLQDRLAAQKLDACLLTQNVDLYYFTGSMQAGYLYIPREGASTFYVRRSAARAVLEADPAVRTVPLGSFSRFAATLQADYPQLSMSGTNSLCRIALDLDVLPAQLLEKLHAVLSTGELGAVELSDGSAIVRALRMHKSAYELGRIEAAAAVVAEALEAALPTLREGVLELHWMARLEYELRIRGHMGLMRMRGYNQEIVTGMVGSGAAAAEPSYFDGPAGGRGLGPHLPQSVSRKCIARNEPILIDIGCCIDGYVIDQTRTAVIGKLDDELASAYAAAERILRQTEAALVPGASCEQLYADSLMMAEEAGLSAHFMGSGLDQARFLGHGIGLEIDEWPILARGFKHQLEPGMVLAIEPKFTFTGKGVVGIENTYAVTETGAPRPLTRSPEGLLVLP